MKPAVLSCLALAGLLTGCDQLGIETPAKREAEGQAIGSACRHAGRALEDCYTLNLQVSRSAIFAGWKEMDQYMRDNDLPEISPVLPPPQSEPKKKKKKAEAKDEGEAKAITEGSAGHDSKVASGDKPANAVVGTAETKPPARPATGSGARVAM